MLIVIEVEEAEDLGLLRRLAVSGDEEVNLVFDDFETGRKRLIAIGTIKEVRDEEFSEGL